MLYKYESVHKLYTVDVERFAGLNVVSNTLKFLRKYFHVSLGRSVDYLV